MGDAEEQGEVAAQRVPRDDCARGFQVVEEGRRPSGPWAIIRAGEAMLCLYETPRPKSIDEAEIDDQPMHRLRHMGFRITDEAAWRETLEREGLKTYYYSPVRYGSSTSWYVKYPTGYGIEVVCWDEDTIRFPEAA